MTKLLDTDLRRAMENQANCIKIDLAKDTNINKQIIKAFLTEDAGYSISSAYNTPLDGDFSFSKDTKDAKTGAVTGSKTFSLGGLQNLLSSVSVAANVLAGTKIPVIAAKSIIQSVSVWTGTGPIPLDLSLTFLTLDEDDDILAQIKLLNATVLPNPVVGGSVGNFFGLKAPNDYTLGVNSNASNVSALGSLAIQIGEWFQTPPVFIVKSFTPSFSKVLTKSKKPLYANVRLSLETYRTMFLEEVNDWFTVKGQKTANFSDTDTRAAQLRSAALRVAETPAATPAPTPAP